MIYAKLKITGRKPKIEKILADFLVYNFSVDKAEDSIILKLSVPTAKGLGEIVRRLKAKKDRPDTQVEVVEMGEM